FTGYLRARVILSSARTFLPYHKPNSRLRYHIISESQAESKADSIGPTADDGSNRAWWVALLTSPRVQCVSVLVANYHTLLRFLILHPEWALGRSLLTRLQKFRTLAGVHLLHDMMQPLEKLSMILQSDALEPHMLASECWCMGCQRVGCLWPARAARAGQTLSWSQSNFVQAIAADGANVCALSSVDALSPGHAPCAIVP
ncbi:hypothetical protein HaLaN_18152, partial [Haematococcus lacustris]